jgi:mono/diheme cytochrome c family protein
MQKATFLCATRGVLGRLLLAIATCLSILIGTLSASAPAFAQDRVADLNQGWSDEEIELYNHSSEGTNLAPIDFVLHLPDPQRPGKRFLQDLPARYGFIPSQPSSANPHSLPVGFAIDRRPEAFGDRPYLGMTCATCHTRELSHRTRTWWGASTSWRLPVHGGPSLVNLPAFTTDLYDAFLALIGDDAAMQTFASDVLNKPPTDADIALLRQEIRDVTGPVLAMRKLIASLKVDTPDFGPGNLNALTQGYYNNAGLIAWLTQQGLREPSGEQPLRIGFEGTVNYPPVWFSHQDTWAQWFAEIHHPGARNWVQSVSSSPVRPPKMVAALKDKAILASIDFNRIDLIQEAIKRLRTPKWPESVLGRLDPDLVARGAPVFSQHCASCHVPGAATPNALGHRFRERKAFAVGTDPVDYAQFASDAVVRADALTRLSNNMLQLRQAQLSKRLNDDTLVANQVNADSRGLPNRFALGSDYASPGSTAAAYWAPPMQGIFASSPYLHNGSVPTLKALLTPPEQRPTTFHTGSNAYDPVRVGLTDEGPFLYDTSEEGKGNQGHAYGTSLSDEQKRALLEYLKSR